VHIDGVVESFLRKAKSKAVKEQKKLLHVGRVLGNGSFKGVVVVVSRAARGCSPLAILISPPEKYWRQHRFHVPVEIQFLRPVTI
jgi:hypothetical protein